MAIWQCVDGKTGNMASSILAADQDDPAAVGMAPAPMPWAPPAGDAGGARSRQATASGFGRRIMTNSLASTPEGTREGEPPG